MSRTRIALVAGLTLLATALLLVLLRAPAHVVRRNGAAGKALAQTWQAASYCQPHELVPKGTSTIRASLSAYTGPSVDVTVWSDGRVATRGSRGSAWTGRVVTIPIRPLTTALHDARICISFSLRDESVTVYGASAPASRRTMSSGRSLHGRMALEYLRPGKRSWVSMAGTIIQHLGSGRAGEGVGIVLVAIVLMLVTIGLIVNLLLGELP